MPQLACESFVTVDQVTESVCACTFPDGTDEEVIEEYIDDASDVLYVLSGGRFTGRCTRTVWPYRPFQVCWPANRGMYYRESWVDYDSIDSIPLQGPDTTIIEVTIDGLVIDPSEYGLLEGHKLFRKGNKSWPSNNDITLADTEDGTFTITYGFGWAPNMMARRAAIELICQMIMGESQALTRLRGIVSANVQGVSVQLDDDDVRSLGLPEVSKFMDIYGASGRGALGVYTPELNHGWRLLEVTTGTVSS